MNVKEILVALKSGQISPEEAEKQMNSLLSSVTDKPNDNAVVRLEEVSPGVALVTMEDKKDKNTFSIDLVVGLMKAFTAIQEDSKFKAVVMTGYDSYFACGGNKEGMQAIHDGKVKMTEAYFFRLPLDCKIPVIAAMQGHAIGSGLCMGLFCDFIVMSSESFYTCNHMQYGFTPGDGATFIVPEKLGVNLGNEILYTGRNYRGSELAGRGVQIPVLPRKEVLPYAIKLAAEVAQAPLESLVLMKAHMTDSIKKRVEETVKKEWEMQQQTFISKPETIQKILSAFQSTPETQKEEQSEVTSRDWTKMLTEMKESYTKGILNKNPVKIPDTSPITNKTEGKKQYTELIHLNKSATGRPVFWIHGDGGGLEGYQVIAGRCKRPFYGLQALGKMSGKESVTGIPDLASYYVKLIRSVQNEGPYDLGGYSLGGAIAYEVARQLQMQGQAVGSIVMVNTLDTCAMEKIRFSEETKILQAVNMSLAFRIRQEPRKMVGKFFKREEIAPDLSSGELLKYLIKTGKSRGLSSVKSEEELYEIFQHNLRVQQSFEADKFQVLPLPDRDALTCYYIRNKNDAFLGPYEPYFLFHGDKTPEDLIDHWEEWRRQMAHFHLVDIEADSHLLLMFEPDICARIAEICKNFYKE